MIRIFATLCLLSVITVAAQPPDLVLFLSDDLSLADCSPYGGKEAATPNMTQLAKDGMRFTNAFVLSPSCAPSRAALLTGLEPMRNGAMLNHARPKAELKKWPAYFHDLGYEVVAIGKTAHYAQANEYGFDHVSHFKYHEDDCIVAAVKWLEERKSKKPLCLIVGTNWPHVPWPKESKHAVNIVPPKLVDTPETRVARNRYLAAVDNADRDLGLIRAAAKKHLGADHLFAFTSDHGSQFPFGKWNCYDAGIHVPLIVARAGVITPGSTTSAMVNWTDLLPTFIEVAGGAALEKIDGKSFTAVLKNPNQPHRERIFATHSGDGKMNAYPIRAVRTSEWKYIRNLDPAAEHHTHVDLGNDGSDGRAYWDSWVKKAKNDSAAAALIEWYHKRPAEELYDLRNDPNETRNLVADPKQTERLRSLRNSLNEWMNANGDQGQITEKAIRNPRPKP